MTRWPLIALAAVSIACVGVGLGWVVHPGAGVAAVGGLLWFEFKTLGAGSKQRR